MKYSTGIWRGLLARLERLGHQTHGEGQALKAIVGLGNPGQKYAQTRHNVGFMVVDELLGQLPPAHRRERFRAHLWETRLGDERILLAKPQTYMNLSGPAVQQLRGWYKLGNPDILIIYDDVDLEFGTLRMKENGSAGGHNGLSSIIASLGTTEIPRLRVGIGRGKSATTAHVLSSFSPQEEPELARIIATAAEGALIWLREGAVPAMNVVNQRPRQVRQQESVLDTFAARNRMLSPPVEDQDL